jgi:hypothetical protein
MQVINFTLRTRGSSDAMVSNEIFFHYLLSFNYARLDEKAQWLFNVFWFYSWPVWYSCSTTIPRLVYDKCAVTGWSCSSDNKQESEKMGEIYVYPLRLLAFWLRICFHSPWVGFVFLVCDLTWSNISRSLWWPAFTHEGISAFSVWTQCGQLSPQSLANFAEIRFRSAIVPGW